MDSRRTRPRLPDSDSSASTHYGNGEDSLGYPPGSGDGQAGGQEQTDCVKELTNKLCWVLGSTYGKNYSSKKGPVYFLAQRIAKGIVRASGYSKSK